MAIVKIYRCNILYKFISLRTVHIHVHVKDIFNYVLFLHGSMKFRRIRCVTFYIYIYIYFSNKRFNNVAFSIVHFDILIYHHSTIVRVQIMASNAWTTIYLNVNIILNAYTLKKKKKFLKSNYLFILVCDDIKTVMYAKMNFKWSTIKKGKSRTFQQISSIVKLVWNRNSSGDR